MWKFKIITFEHVQHALGDDEATSDIDAGQQDCQCTKSLRNSAREISTTHNEHACNTHLSNVSIGMFHDPGDILTRPEIALVTDIKGE